MKSVNSKKTRKLNTFYLENRQHVNLSATSIQQSSTVTNVLSSINNEKNNHMYYLQAKENRRRRKLYLDNKRLKTTNIRSSIINPSTPHVLKNMDSCNFLIKINHINLRALVFKMKMFIHIDLEEMKIRRYNFLLHT
uniref:Uncharacterized protein n=1 Tax=Lactuca sativa TaxID=4236 RepID=A0A9R1UUE3_LACSA|nr:hypothetical protein LSAT_V11C800411500 [Lactuca sativa]